MPHTVLMSDPRYFSVLGGANPHTRNVFGVRNGVRWRARSPHTAVAAEPVLT